jgi:IS5 family transposase
LSVVVRRGRPPAARLRAALDGFVPLVDRVIAQTRRRVEQGEAVPAADEVVSRFEPPTCLGRRGTARQPTEFGRQVWLDDVEGGPSAGTPCRRATPRSTSRWPPA